MKNFKAVGKKSSNNKNLSFFIRLITLFVFVAAAIISIIFSSFYLENNGNLSIEFSGGYRTEVKYTGNASSNNVINMLEQRVDPLGTSNIDITKSSSNGNYYSVAISKQAGISESNFISNLSRSGYVYLIDSQGHDLLANTFDGKTWTQSQKRITVNDAFSAISEDTNPNSHQPEVIFNIKDSTLSKEVSSVLSSNDKIYFYSDIGNLLNSIRNNINGLEQLVTIYNGVSDATQKQDLLKLFANTVPTFSGDGSAIITAVTKPGSDSFNKLSNLLNEKTNGAYTFAWQYTDAPNSQYKLSADTNSSDIKQTTSSAMNAWLPYINKLILIPSISQFLNTEVINYHYAPYYIGTITSSASVANNVIRINDNTFNQQKVQQITYLLNAGKGKNIFQAISFSQINPTLGSKALEMSIIALIITLVILTIIILINYRLLGVVAALMIIFFFVFTLVAFTFLGNIASPETGIALVISFALLLDVIIGLFSRIVKEHKTGKTAFDAFKTANKKSLSSAFDASLIVLIVSLAIFWFGSRSIQGFAIMTAISTFGVLLIGVVVLRLILYFILKNNFFENKINLLFANKPNTSDSVITTNKLSSNLNSFKTKLFAKLKIDKENKENSFLNISKWNFWHKSSKWIILAFGLVLIASGITYLAGGINFGQGFASTEDFVGETFYQGDTSDLSFNLLKQIAEKKNEVITVLDNNNQKYENIYGSYKLNALDNADSIIKIVVQTNVTDPNQQSQIQSLLNNNTSLTWTYSKDTSLSGSQLFKTLLIVIAISLVVIIIYVFIRFQISFIIPLFLSLIFAMVFALSIIALLHITISTMTIGIILAVLVLTLINSVVIFDRIKEIKLNNSEKINQLKNNEILAISNEGIKKSLSRTLGLNSVIILASLVLIIFSSSLWAVSLSIILGTIVSFVATHFIAPWLWTFFERTRIKNYKKRAKKIKKHFVGPDEYIIKGIND